MRNSIMAGGGGMRPYPATLAVSKQILLIHDSPMFNYLLGTLMLAGIKKVLIVSIPWDLPQFRKLPDDGSALGISLNYAGQPPPNGMAKAFIFDRNFSGNSPNILILFLCDDIFYGDSLSEHCQAAVAQHKFVRVLHGAVFVVAVDIRQGSATSRQWVGLELSAAAWNQILLPKGYVHGFVTPEPDTELVCKVSAPSSQSHDRLICLDDPANDIRWPMAADSKILSAKDVAAPLLADAETGFFYS